MFHVHSSNRLENLLAGAVSVIEEQLGDPLLPEVIIVQNPGMSRWVSQQIALAQGISANLSFVTPGSYLWQLAGRCIDDLPVAPEHTKPSMTWRIFEALPSLIDRAEFAPLQRYLEADSTGLKRFQLSQRVAAVFDQYLVYRPDMIMQWQQGRDDQWQAVLWRQLAKSFTHKHWGHVYDAVHSGTVTFARSLPPRLTVFGVADMPPLYITLLQQVARHTDVYLYYLNPSSAYWADIEDKRSQSRRRARNSSLDQACLAGLLDVGNPLLASWGHAGQAFLDQLLEADVTENDNFVSNADLPSAGVLHDLQNDILELQESAPGALYRDGDETLQIHCAHSLLREVQVLHDQLLHLFETLPDLQPRDIIVMAPDIDRYAPFIDATFTTAGDAKHLPWSVSDRRLRFENGLLEVLYKLVQLPTSRFESSELLSLLELPALRKKFGVNDNGYRLLQQWVRESGIRWSFDGQMRGDFDLPEDNTNSWSFGLQRLFAGFALGDTDELLYNGIAPYVDIEGLQTDQLQALQSLIDYCAQWRKRLQQRHPFTGWLLELEHLIGTFFDADDTETHVLQTVRSRLHEIAVELVDDDQPLSREVFAEVLHGILEDSSGVRQFLTGRITFSNMVPMRAIPFRVVCVLGLSAVDFPRASRPPSFDLMARSPRRGDRQRRNDDRYLFLETLLCARDVLYLSYVGRDGRDNTVKAPSTVLRELQEYTGVPVIEHPLQPFSKRYFDQSNDRLVSYREQWLAAAKVNPDTEGTVFVTDDLAKIDSEYGDVALYDLIEFLVNPARHFLKTRLDVRHGYKDSLLESTEPFALDGLGKWQLNQDIYALCAQGASESTALQTARARGVLPAGPPGDSFIASHYVAMRDLHQQVQRHAEPAIADVEFELPVGYYRLFGVLDRLHCGGRTVHWVGRLRVKDMISAWVSHLVLCAIAPDKVSLKSVLVTEDFTASFSSVDQPVELLQQLLDVRQSGLNGDYSYLPHSALAFALGSIGKEIKSKKFTWKGEFSDPAEDDLKLSEAQTVWRGIENIFGDAFEQKAQLAMLPLAENVVVVATGEATHESA